LKDYFDFDFDKAKIRIKLIDLDVKINFLKIILKVKNKKLNTE
jgi:hypothetical protein